uniref:Homeodomain leucine zipper family IV protein n=1 Tax=Zea mays TaxID=4577 RepID=G2J5S3_MAIZE|nr:TPA_exp: homeodomain leucine zipper family IV protein [Zea mays]
MKRDESSGGEPSFIEPTSGMDDPTLMGSLGGIDGPSLMEPFGRVGGGTSSQTSDIPENGSSNQSVEAHANNGKRESPGDGAARINEVNSSTAVKKKKKRSDRQQQDGPQPKKLLHRVTSQQLEILEGFFSICAHPDDSQRKQLSESTGLSVHQVKFWFQNKRTHVKHLSGREENYRLKVENEMLKEENNRLIRQAQSNAPAPAPAPCPRCINDAGHLLLEKEVERLKALNQMLQQELQLQGTEGETPVAVDPASGAFHPDPEPSLENVFAAQHDGQMLAKLAENAAQELLVLADPESPLWLPVPGGSFETLNMIAYAQTFPGQMSVDAIALKTEATRASGVVMLDPKSLVEFLMDAESYGTMFPGLVSGAATDKVYNWPTSREESYDGAVQMMTVELAFPSPLVAARKCTFVRCCKKLEQGAFAVVDVSLDDGARCRKMPSGMLIQPIRYNSCKVSAIDHVRVDDTSIHDIFHPCLSGVLFGARRWVTSMARQCARIRDVFHVTNCTLNVTSRGRKTIMKLADNLLADYTSSVAAFPDDAWTVQCGVGTEQDIKIMYKRQSEGSSSSSNTAVVCACASFLLPLRMRKAFDLLKNNLLRAKVLVSLRPQGHMAWQQHDPLPIVMGGVAVGRTGERRLREGGGSCRQWCRKRRRCLHPACQAWPRGKQGHHDDPAEQQLRRVRVVHGLLLSRQAAGGDNYEPG